jgi:serine O-acetyltransferase
VIGQLRRDLEAARRRDPAARNSFEVALTYPGVHAIWAHRVANWLWRHQLRLVARSVASVAQQLTGVEIHPAARIGSGLFIDHAFGVVIGETAEVGDDVTIYQGVTLGGTSLQRGKRHPTIGNRVTIGAGAKILGPVTIGDDCRIGANAVVVKSAPANSVVVGVPGQIIARSKSTDAAAPELQESSVPDLVGLSLQSLLRRVDELETQINGHRRESEPRPSVDGIWAGEDFSI